MQIDDELFGRNLAEEMIVGRHPELEEALGSDWVRHVLQMGDGDYHDREAAPLFLYEVQKRSGKFADGSYVADLEGMFRKLVRQEGYSAGACAALSDGFLKFESNVAATMADIVPALSKLRRPEDISAAVTVFGRLMDRAPQHIGVNLVPKAADDQNVWKGPVTRVSKGKFSEADVAAASADVFELYADKASSGEMELDYDRREALSRMAINAISLTSDRNLARRLTDSAETIGARAAAKLA